MLPTVSSNTKGLIFIFEDIGAQDFIKSITSAGPNDIHVVCASDKMKNQLLKNGFDCRAIGDYSVDSEAEIQRARKWMTDWPDKPVLNGQSFKELLVYNGISIYWYLQTRLYLHRTRELIVLIGRIRQIIDNEKPSNVWIKGNSDVAYIVSNLYEDRIRVVGSAEGMSTGKINFKSYRGFPTLKILLLKLLRGTLVASGRNTRIDNRVLVVAESSSWRRTFNYATGNYESRDIFFHDIINGLVGSSCNVTIIDFENRANQVLTSYSTLRRKQASFGAPVIPWEKYVNYDIIKKSRVASKHFAGLWKHLRNSSEFVQSLDYDGLSLHELLRADIDDLFASLKAYAAVTFIEVAKRILELEKPAIVIMHDEYGALQLSIIKVAKDLGIPTLSIQHGLISEEQIAYVHEPNHIIGKNTDILFPIPDKMCVWSEHFKDAVISVAKFPPSVPVVTGDPKLDYLPSAVKSFRHDQISERLRIPTGKRIVMLATENLPSEEEKSIITNTVIEAISQIPDSYLIVKLHPNEQNSDFYHAAAKKRGLTNSKYTVLKDIDLYEIIYISDLVIVSYSTVALEAMRFGKPVISLNLLGLHDSVTFIKQNMAVVVRTTNDLLPSIKRCLDRNEIDHIVGVGKAFAEKELGVVDSMASERVRSLALQLMNDYQSKLASNIP